MSFPPFVCGLALVLLSVAGAQVPFTGVHSENFDGMGTGTSAPAGWTVHTIGTASGTWTASIPESGTNSAATPGTANATLIRQDDPTASVPSNSAAYNFGVTGGGRSLGTSPTSLDGIALQLRLTNQTGRVVSGLRLSYDIMRFRNAGTTNELPGYWLFYSLDGGTTWTNVTALNPTVAGPSGVVVPNSVGVTSVPTSTVTLSPGLAAGGEIRFRWIDDNAGQSSPDQITGLDNVSITATKPVPNVTLAAPADGASLGSGGLVKLRAAVSDPEAAPLTVTFHGRAKATQAGGDFTLVTLPDTQFYSENHGGTRFQLFTSQTNWIVASKEPLNTRFVAHMGDMVNTASSAQEWTNAKQAMNLIEDPLTTLLTHGMPWGGAPGNHDGTGSEWDTHFGPSRFAGRDYYQGNYNNSNRNNYQFFSAGGMDFIVINLAYNSNTAGTPAIMDWADALLKAHPDRRAIVTSHWLVGVGNPAAWGGHGQALYDNLKDNPNLFLMLCGHVHGEGRRADVFEGRTVHTVLQDYQGRTNGGDSWLRYFTFKPSENKIHAYTYKTDTAPAGNPLGGTFETDADSQFTLDYNMGSTAPWTALGTVSLAGGETSATQTWTGLNPDTVYEWYAAVSDGQNAPVATVVREFTTNGNAAPEAILTSPAGGASFTLPQTVPLAASADDIDGSIARVEFYQDATKIGEDDSAPYAIDWSAPAGSFTLGARAVDAQGAHTDSAAVSITVADPTPVVTIEATDSAAGEFGTDHALACRVSRTGSTGASLAVRLAATGTASAGDDFSGFASLLDIPAGSAFADLALTVRADGLAEGPETLAIGIAPDAAYQTGTPGSATTDIADHPAQQHYFTHIANAAMRGPLDDADGDGSSNLLEYFFGSQPGDAASRGQLRPAAADGGLLKAIYPQGKNRPGVTGKVRWSPDLASWFLSGQSDGERIYEIRQSVISPPEEDPETVEATATKTHGPEAGRVFLRLDVTEETDP